MEPVYSRRPQRHQQQQCTERTWRFPSGHKGKAKVFENGDDYAYKVVDGLAIDRKSAGAIGHEPLSLCCTDWGVVRVYDLEEADEKTYRNRKD
mgnify:CR=1 FL=1